MRNRWVRSLAAVALAGLAGVGCQTDAEWLAEAIASEAHVHGQRHAPHRVALLENGGQALVHRVKLIREAKESIRLQTFIFSNDPVGRFVVNEMVAAARRGVRVRILADTMFSTHDLEALARVVVASPNFEVKAYNPPTNVVDASALATMGAALANLGKVSQRMHNKVFIVDGRTIVCGGRNWADEYFDEDPVLNFRDRDLAIEGPVVADAVASFDHYWDFALSVPLSAFPDIVKTVKKMTPEQLAWRSSAEELRLGTLPERCGARLAAGEPALTWHTVHRIAFWADQPGKPPTYQDPTGVPRRLASLLGGAWLKVRVQSPYLVLSGRAVAMCDHLLKKGVMVEVSTNSLAATDSWVTYAHTLRQRKMMVRDLEMRIHEMKPYPEDLRHYIGDYDGLCARARPTGDEAEPEDDPRPPKLCLHAKTVVMDDAVAVVGSYNLDPRSGIWNSEIAVAIWDEELALALDTELARDLHPRNSWTIAPRPRPLVIAPLAALLMEINDAVRAVTTLDLWPFRYCSLYELKPGMEPVSREHPQFYERYESAGQFPGVEETSKIVLTRLTQALTGFLKPLM